MARGIPERVENQRRKIVVRIVEDMNKDGLTWVKPWSEMAAPHNPVSGTVYAGRNRLHLALIAHMRGYDDSRWVTFNQAKKAGWQMRKGAKSAVVEKWKQFEAKADGAGDGSEREPGEERVFARCIGYWNIFNACEFNNAPPLPAVVKNTDEEIGLLADEIIFSSRCPVSEKYTDRAFYQPATDKIEIPLRDLFSSNMAFIGTLLHEMSHSTGHHSALNRNLLGEFGSKAYATEELTAELASVFAACDLGLQIDMDENSEHCRQHVGYLASWMKDLADNPDVLFSAASAADKAARYLMKRYENSTGKALGRCAAETSVLHGVAQPRRCACCSRT